MEFKFKKIDISKDDIYRYDKLNRKTEVENLTLLLTNISSPIVLSINSPWGTGKTTFVQMLNEELLSNNEISILFNAWETDYAKDPLLAFLGEMNIALESQLKGSNSQAWKQAKTIGINILKSSIPAIIRIGTAGIIDASEIIKEETSKLLEGFSDDLIKEYTKNKEAIHKFKKNISQAIASIDGENKKLYIFVDELDRCRPTYAIELLERIKHLLDIKGLVFVLSLDKEQLSHSIKSIYGSNFDAIGYLKRFIDIEYKLDTKNIVQFIDYNFDFFNFKSFFESRTKYDDFRNESSILRKVLLLLINNLEMTLREIEQLFAKLNLVLLSTKENIYIYPELLAFLVIISERYPNIYKNYISKSNKTNEAIDCLYSIIPENERYNSYECANLEANLLAAKTNNGNFADAIETHNKIIEDGNQTAEAKSYSNRVITAFNQTIILRNRISLNSIVSRIEMLEKYNFNMSE